MPTIYLLSHYGAYNAFEDYCQGFRLHSVTPVVYHDENDIPLDDKAIYFFLSYIPPKFYYKHINGENAHIHLINTEQSTRPLWSIMLQHYRKHRIKIYDYDLYQAQNNHLYYLPYQITEIECKYLHNLILENPKYYNVAICSVNRSRRRANIYNKLQQRGLKVIDVCGWKETRDQKISQAQILLNIHYDTDYQIFEHFRCDRWILSGMLTVSETSLSDDLLDCKNLLIIEPYNTIVDKIVEIVANYQQYYQQYLEKLVLVQNQIISDRIKTLEDNIKIT